VSCAPVLVGASAGGPGGGLAILGGLLFGGVFFGPWLVGIIVLGLLLLLVR
jgi:hypothetical protein